MKSHSKILVAFWLNMLFSLIEFIGGTLTGSVAIISDSIHDLGDGLSIGVSFILEKLSHKKPDGKYTFGYLRYSVLGSVFMSLILIFGSVLVIYNAILRIIHPTPVNYDGMIWLAILGIGVNGAAVIITHRGKSLNQTAVNLHMLEDVLGWVAVLLGALVMKITHFPLIDPLLSIAVTVFILAHAFKDLFKALGVFLERKPGKIPTQKIIDSVLEIDEIKDIHHLHIWSIDGYNHCATAHIVTDSDDITAIKKTVKKLFLSFDIIHTTLEIETSKDGCDEIICNIEPFYDHPEDR